MLHVVLQNAAQAGEVLLHRRYQALLRLLDEPAAGLNDDESAALGETLRELAATGIGIVLIEHDIDLVMNVSRRIFVMDAGAVIAEGTPEAVRANPAVVKAYLGDEHAAA